MSDGLDLGSIADWIAAIGTMATAVIAIPAALAFMADRRAAKSALVELQPWGGTSRPNAIGMRATFMAPDRSLAADAYIRLSGRNPALLQARDLTSYSPLSREPKILKAADPPSRILEIPMGRYSDTEGTLTAYFDLLESADQLVDVDLQIRRHPDGKIIARKRQSVGVRKRPDRRPVGS